MCQDGITSVPEEIPTEANRAYKRLNLLGLELVSCGDYFQAMDSPCEKLRSLWIYVRDIRKNLKTWDPCEVRNGLRRGLTVDELCKVHTIYHLFARIVDEQIQDQDYTDIVYEFVFDNKSVNIDVDLELLQVLFPSW